MLTVKGNILTVTSVNSQGSVQFVPSMVENQGICNFSLVFAERIAREIGLFELSENRFPSPDSCRD